MEKTEFYRRLVLGFEGTSPSTDFLKLLERIRPGGVIFFERNFEDPNDLAEHSRIIRNILPKALIMMDQEGGEKSRLRSGHGFPNPPNPRDLPRLLSPGETRRVYRECGESLRELGINVDLAPVLDLAPPKHFLKNRSISENPDIAAEYGIAALSGLLEAGVMPCAKHFPGLGTAILDPHHRVSVAPENADFERHMRPFRRAIRAGVPAVMTTHLRALSLDPAGEIATFSKPIVEMLRTDLSFDGLILSDDLLMSGARARGNLPENIAKAVTAGHDMILLCREIEDLDRALSDALHRLSNTEDHASTRIESAAAKFGF